MVAPVVLEHKSSCGVVEVGPADELTHRVDEVRLDLRPWQSAIDQEPAKSRLHRRLRRRSLKRQEMQPAHAGLSPGRLRIPGQRNRISEASVHSHVDRNQRLHCWDLHAKLGKRDRQRKCPESANRHDIVARNLTVTNDQAVASPHPAGRRHNDLDWIRRLDVEAEEPCRASTSEDSVGRQNAPPPAQRRQGIIRQLRPSIQAGADATPAPAAQASQRQARIPRLLEREGP